MVVGERSVLSAVIIGHFWFWTYFHFRHTMTQSVPWIQFSIRHKKLLHHPLAFPHFGQIFIRGNQGLSMCTYDLHTPSLTSL